MPDLKKKPGKMELIGGKGGKDSMFKSVKQELRQQLEAEIASLDAQIDELVAEIGGFDKDWTDEQIKEHEAMLNMVGELREQHFELLSEEEKAEVREWMEKEAEYLKDLYGIREELEELDEEES